MAHTTAHLNAEVIPEWQCSVKYSLPFLYILGSQSLETTQLSINQKNEWTMLSIRQKNEHCYWSNKRMNEQCYQSIKRMNKQCYRSIKGMNEWTMLSINQKNEWTMLSVNQKNKSIKVQPVNVFYVPVTTRCWQATNFLLEFKVVLLGFLFEPFSFGCRFLLRVHGGNRQHGVRLQQAWLWFLWLWFGIGIWGALTRQIFKHNEAGMMAVRCQ